MKPLARKDKGLLNKNVKNTKHVGEQESGIKVQWLYF